jgi:hypothetical protein
VTMQSYIERSYNDWREFCECLTNAPLSNYSIPKGAHELDFIATLGMPGFFFFLFTLYYFLILITFRLNSILRK